MTKLSFDFRDGRNGGHYRAEYRGLVILAIQDSDAENPWRAWDGQPPLIWTSGDGLNDDAQGEDIESPFDRMSDGYISRHFAKLAGIIGADSAELDSDCRQERKSYGGRLVDYRREKLGEYLAELKPAGSYGSWRLASEYFPALEELWTLLGVPALDFQRNGYSQGDSVRGLLVATPEWNKRVGANYKKAEDLERDADLFGAWAFGDVYGFAIETEDGETLDSCFGYYGDDFEQSGLAEAATEAADSILANAAKRKAAKLKELIRNRVPVAARPAILAEAGKLADVR